MRISEFKKLSDEISFKKAAKQLRDIDSPEINEYQMPFHIEEAISIIIIILLISIFGHQIVDFFSHNVMNIKDAYLYK
jgi:hypothetical protein